MHSENGKWCDEKISFLCSEKRNSVLKNANFGLSNFSCALNIPIKYYALRKWKYCTQNGYSVLRSGILSSKMQILDSEIAAVP